MTRTRWPPRGPAGSLRDRLDHPVDRSLRPAWPSRSGRPGGRGGRSAALAIARTADRANPPSGRYRAMASRVGMLMVKHSLRSGPSLGWRRRAGSSRGPRKSIRRLRSVASPVMKQEQDARFRTVRAFRPPPRPRPGQAACQPVHRPRTSRNASARGDSVSSSSLVRPAIRGTFYGPLEVRDAAGDRRPGDSPLSSMAAWEARTNVSRPGRRRAGTSPQRGLV